MPFWQAVLGYEPRRDSPDEDLVDPHGRGLIWFERMDEPRPTGRDPVAVWVHKEAQERVAAALAAGGRMVRDEFAPSSWTLLDAAGNEADIATTMGRPERGLVHGCMLQLSTGIFRCQVIVTTILTTTTRDASRR